MIFVTTGTQLPFNRLINTLDEWALDKQVEVIAQIGNSTDFPVNIKYVDFLSTVETNKMFQEASLIVSHAGMGSIISALKYKKPLIIMPRKASLGEHRNEHQMATAGWVKDKQGVYVAWEAEDLINLLNQADTLTVGEDLSDFASEELIDNLKLFLSDTA